jgi:hypothetical protein
MANLSALIEHIQHHILLFCQRRILIYLIVKKERIYFYYCKIYRFKNINYIF